MQTFFCMLLLEQALYCETRCKFVYFHTLLKKVSLTFSLHQPGSYLLVAKYSKYRLHIQLLFRSTVIQSLIPSLWTRKLPLMALDSYKKQEGEPWENNCWWAAALGGALSMWPPMRDQYVTLSFLLYSIKHQFVVIYVSYCSFLSWMEASSSRQAMLSAERQQTFHLCCALLLVSNSVLNTSCWLWEWFLTLL